MIDGELNEHQEKDPSLVFERNPRHVLYPPILLFKLN